MTATAKNLQPVPQPTVPVEVIERPVDYDAVTTAIAKVETETRIATEDDVIAALSDGRDFDAHLYAGEIRAYMAHASVSYWEAARRVAHAHAVLPRAEWVDWLEENVGIAQSTGYQMTTIARKLVGRGHVTEHLLGLGATKVFELVSTLEPEEVDALAAGGEAAGLKLDDVSRMGTRKLRKALRDARKAKKTAEKSHHSRRRHTAKRDNFDALLERVGEARVDGETALRKLATLGDEVDWPAAPAQLRAEFAASVTSFQALLADLSSMVSDFGIAPSGPVAVRPDPSSGDTLLALMAAEGLEVGDLVAELGFEITGWSPARLRSAFAELVERGALAENAVGGEYVIESLELGDEGGDGPASVHRLDELRR